MYGIKPYRLLTEVLTIVLLFVCTSSQAQIKKRVVEADTVQVPFINGIAVRADVWGVVQRYVSDCGQYEVGMRLNIKDRYFPAAEVGLGFADQKENYNEASWYKTRAPYFRVGCDYNILRNKHDIYKLFGGVRYGMSRFMYDMTVGTPLSDEDNTLVYSEYNDLSATCHWVEGVFGTDAKIWGPLHLGWDMRYRMKIAGKHDSEGQPWHVPGFGNYESGGFAINFNVIISI